ncbi:MAG: hypothetical protein AAFV95_17550 [Bacteroidota bacterium]
MAKKLHFLLGLVPLLFLFFGADLAAQLPVYVNHNIAQFQDSSNLKFHFYRFESSTIPLTRFKEEYPNWQGPDSIEVQLPNLEDYRDTMILLALLDTASTSEDDLVLWIVTNYFSNQVSFFVDRTMDRNFRNDGPPIVINAGNPRTVEIIPQGNLNESRDIVLDVEVRQQLVRKRYKQKIQQSLSVSGFIGMSNGGLHYQYIDPNIGYPAWYDVHITGRNFGLNLSYEFNRFRLGVQFTYQDFFYWTSTLNIQRGEPYSIFVPITGETIDYRNIASIVNRDKHSNGRFEWGVHFAWRIYLSRWLELQPTINAGIIDYASGKYIASRSLEGQTFEHQPDPFVEAGVQFEPTIGNRKALFVALMFNKAWWNPEPFFESREHEDLNIRFHTFKVLIGFKVGLW